MKLKKKCCAKYRRKATACKRCPLVASLSRKQRRRKIKKLRRKLKAA